MSKTKPDGFPSAKIDLLVASLAKAQAEIKAPERNRTVTVKSQRTGGEYTFAYATLDKIIETIRPALTKNGLWFTQIMVPQFDGPYPFVLVTKLLHESGQSIETVTPLIVSGGSNQEFGSALTYMRRYALTSLLGIASEEDDDGNAADGNAVQKAEPRAPKAPAPDVIKDAPAAPATRATPLPETPATPDIIQVVSGVAGALDWVGWARTYLAALANSKTPEEKAKWIELNATQLEGMKVDRPKVYANLLVALERGSAASS